MPVVDPEVPVPMTADRRDGNSQLEFAERTSAVEWDMRRSEYYKPPVQVNYGEAVEWAGEVCLGLEDIMLKLWFEVRGAELGERRWWSKYLLYAESSLRR
jgi:hypothetical protein